MALNQSSSESLILEESQPELVSSSELSVSPSTIIHAAGLEDASRPSPIDININHAEKLTLPALEWHNYEKLPSKVKLTNTGETVILSAKWTPENDRPFLTGGPLEGRRYLFSQLHFHWGNTAVEGSEHTVDGAHLPVEMHVMHFSDEFDNQDEALEQAGGVLAVVYFFTLKSAPNEFISPVIDNLKEIIFPDSVFKPEPFPIVRLFHSFTNDYFLYWGSTRSGESRSNPLLWMISRTQECIDFDQLTQFRVLIDSRMRVIQREPTKTWPLDGRHLFHVNPLTAYCNSTLSVLPHPRYRKDRWVVDRMAIDIGAPGACRELIEAIREEIRRKKEKSPES